MFFRDGSGALGLCYVAAGRLVGFFEPLIKSWDAMGAIAVCEGAGARVSDFLSNDGLFKGNSLIAATPAAYAEIERIVSG